MAGCGNGDEREEQAPVMISPGFSQTPVAASIQPRFPASTQAVFPERQSGLAVK